MMLNWLNRNRIRSHRMHAALMLMLCAVSITAQARDEEVERVIALGTDCSFVLEKNGPAVLANVIFTDKAVAQTWLSEHVLQQLLPFVVVGIDRYGRSLIKSPAEISMLREGVAVTDRAAESDPALLAAETQARIAGRGVWGQAGLVLNATETSAHLGEFHLVSGTITRIYESRSATYLNFGDDWKTDFSIKIPKRVRRYFVQLDTMREGQRITARGVLINENGPMLVLSRPQQLEMR